MGLAVSIFAVVFAGAAAAFTWMQASSTRTQAATDRQRLHLERTPTFHAVIEPRQPYSTAVELRLRLDSHHPVERVTARIIAQRGIQFQHSQDGVDGGDLSTASGGPLRYGATVVWLLTLNDDRPETMDLEIESTDVAGERWETTVSRVKVPSPDALRQLLERLAEPGQQK